VTRARDAADERQLAVTLTAEGAALREQALAIPPAVVERLGMSLDELRDLHAVLTRVIAASERS
jgi:DNA-binding MarR family transcriptional regulator